MTKTGANRIRFLLDNEIRDIADIAPTRTLLSWLRENCHRTGTKEGCAEGDCGACTVVVAEACGDGLQYRAVNSCIQFLPTLDGKALFTVESLRGADGALHPVQDAMVTCHGSQCGFCTPGFVMSLFALYQTEERPDRQAVCTALSGNLCRCTGYRPILDAAQRMYELPAPPFDGAALRARIDELARTDDLVVQHGDQRFIAPLSLDSFAAHFLAHPEATILAGGTDIGLWVTKHFRDLPVLLSLGNVRELKVIRDAGGVLEIGAAVTLEETFPALVAHYPALQELFDRFASRPIRNAGTLCGNIANGSPIGDSMPALIALEAKLRLRKGKATRDVRLDQFYLAYQKTALTEGEFVEAVLIPLPHPERDRHFRAYKISKRYDQDISAVFAGLSVDLADGCVSQARLAFGGMAATPMRAAAAEAALLGARFDRQAITAAQQALAQDFTPLSDMRASAGYRLRVAQNLLLRFLQERDDAGTLTRVNDLDAVTS